MTRSAPTLTGKSPRPNTIGTLQERSLHAALKGWYALPGDQMEVLVDGYLVDIVRGELLIEIQTRNFAALKRKLLRLTETHPVRLVHPIAQEKWILRLAGTGEAADTRPTGAAPLEILPETHADSPPVPTGSRRRSPKRGRLEHLFMELVRFPALIGHPNFSLEVLITREEEVRVNDGRGAWRRKGWSITDRRLLEVVERVVLAGPQDFRVFLPEGLPEPFTARELARARGVPAYVGSKMAYCLREMGIIAIAGMRRRAYLYSRR